MAVLVQLIMAVLVGAAAWGLSELFGIPDPWPIVLGVVMFLLVMGVCVLIIDGELFD